MTSSPSARERRNALERQLAPHVDTRWADPFIVELRALGVSGPVISEALSDVEAHCTKNGVSAVEAFGKPIAHARRLARGADADDAAARGGFAAIGPMIAQVAGMALLVWSSTDLFRGQPFTLTAGHVATGALLAAELVALGVAGERLVSAVVHHPVWSWLALMANLAAMVAFLALLGTRLTQVDSGWAAGVGAGLLAGGVAWDLVRKVVRRRGGADGVGRRSDLGVGLVTCLIPVSTALMLIYIWWLG